MKEKILDYIKANLKVLPVTIMFCAASVSAASIMIDSRTVAYTDNGNVRSVQEALDTLYNSVEVTTITPVGSILPYMGNTAPINYLICDGEEYNITDYKKLADFIKENFGSYNYFGGNGTTTFAVPDLRGEFLRGSGTNSHENQGSGASVGEHQDGTELPSLYSNLANSKIWVGVFSNGTSKSITNGDYVHQVNGYGGAISASYNTGNVPIYFTSRPTNTSVNYIIKVK